MLPLSRTKQVFAGLIILNVLLVGGFAGLYYFLDNRAQAANRLSAKVERVSNQKQREKALQNLVDQTAETRSELDDYFIGANASAEFITLIESIADDTRVDLQIGNVSIDSADTVDNSQKLTNPTELLTMEVQASGSWNRVVHFVRAIELLPQKTSISNVSFSQSGRPAQESSQSLWSVTATIEAHKLTSQ
jgi:Tfp pilus assembly protein PilO